MNKIQQKKEILKDSLQLANNIMKIDAAEYEIPDELYEFRSTRSFISNLYRIRRIKRIMKNIEDKEQLGAYDVNVEKLKKIKKNWRLKLCWPLKEQVKQDFLNFGLSAKF